MNKKAIHPVVATSLLLIVAVVAVIGFQTWFGSFSSQLFSQAEQDGSSDSLGIQIETISGTNLYFKNPTSRNLSITQVKVNGNDCSVNENAIANSISTLDISSCISGVSGKTEVVVVTNKDIFSKQVFLKNSILVCTDQVAEGFAGGDGTSGDPFEICNCDQLQNVDNYLSNSFILTSNIDCSATSSWNSGAGFLPIGNGSAFGGTLNGNGYSILNLYINRSLTDYVGLFYFTDAITMENIHLRNVDITGRDYVGGLVGQSRTAFSRISVTGTISGRNHVGGVYGRIVREVHSNSYFSGNVTGDYYIGGIVGLQQDWLENSYSAGTINGTQYLGGISGELFSSITSSFTVTNVNNSLRSGGIVGVFHSGYGNIYSQTYWNNMSSNPSIAVGHGTGTDNSNVTQDNLSYYYSNSNPPMSSWSTSTWSFSGSSLPTLIWENN